MLECPPKAVCEAPILAGVPCRAERGGNSANFLIMERQTVSLMKACEIAGVSRRTIYNWIAANKVEYLRTAGGSIRIFVDTLFRNPDGSHASPE